MIVPEILQYQISRSIGCLLKNKAICGVSVPNDARHVIVQKLALVVPGRNDVELDLTGTALASFTV